VPLTKLTPQQEEIITMPLSGSCFLEGPAGTGKTTTAVQRLLHMIHSGIPPESILIVVPQRTLRCALFAPAAPARTASREEWPMSLPWAAWGSA
jgi:hypothetical protein